MKELSKKLHKKLKEFEDGKLGIEELEELTEDARELYERLLIVKYKAYEKYGAPKSAETEAEEVVAEEPIAEEKVEEVVEEKVVAETVEEEAPKEEPTFDFTSVSDESEEEQPAFDFSSSEEAEEEEEHETFPEDADIKNEAPKAEAEVEAETFPEDAEIKASKQDIFKDSHVEKHEPEDENSLNQKLGDAEDELSLRKKLQSSPVTDLKSEISIAKKFEYITFMFEGKNELYEEAIDSLNNCSDGEEAKNKLNEYSTKYNWDLENKSIIKFVELVERRYL